MIYKIQVVTIGEDGREETREITTILRTDAKGRPWNPSP